MATTPDFEHRIEIKVDRPVLREFLCDLGRYRELHPLIESIRELPAEDSAPNARRYRVVDRLPLGPFSFKGAYTASIEAVQEDEVHGNAWQPPRVHLLTVYKLEDYPGGTRIVERSYVEAPWYLRRYVRNQARESHRTTLARMKSLLEKGEPSD